MLGAQLQGFGDLGELDGMEVQRSGAGVRNERKTRRRTNLVVYTCETREDVHSHPRARIGFHEYRFTVLRFVSTFMETRRTYWNHPRNRSQNRRHVKRRASSDGGMDLFSPTIRGKEVERLL